MNANRIVSSESEELILVDKNDVEIGSLSKARCHDGDGILHRAFSLFIFNPDGDLLLQTGDYIRFELGTRHSISSRDGCLLLVTSSLRDSATEPPPAVR